MLRRSVKQSIEVAEKQLGRVQRLKRAVCVGYDSNTALKIPANETVEE